MTMSYMTFLVAKYLWNVGEIAMFDPPLRGASHAFREGRSRRLTMRGRSKRNDDALIVSQPQSRDRSACEVSRYPDSRYTKSGRTAANVRFGSFCDIGATLAEVRFVAHSGHRRQLTSAKGHEQLIREQCSPHRRCTLQGKIPEPTMRAGLIAGFVTIMLLTTGVVVAETSMSEQNVPKGREAFGRWHKDRP